MASSFSRRSNFSLLNVLLIILTILFRICTDLSQKFLYCPSTGASLTSSNCHNPLLPATNLLIAIKLVPWSSQTFSILQHLSRTLNRAFMIDLLSILSIRIAITAPVSRHLSTKGQFFTTFLLLVKALISMSNGIKKFLQYFICKIIMTFHPG